MRWVAFFSQTGSEILNIIDKTDIEPDRIVTDRCYAGTQDLELYKRYQSKFFFVPKKPSSIHYELALTDTDINTLITLHGYLKIVPPCICKLFNIYNGHPGLITKYPELKGKDPQEKAYKLEMKETGSVIHKVTAEIDSGDIVSESPISIEGKTLDEVYVILHNNSTNLWINFIKERYAN